MNTKMLLKSWRAKNGYTIRDMDKLLDISGNTYNKYENNPMKCPVNIILEIIEVLNGNLDEFLFTIVQDKKSCYQNKNK